MPIRVAVPKETAAGERRVAMSADVVKRLARLGVEVHIQAGAGIVYDSIPECEYEETRNKAASILDHINRSWRSQDETNHPGFTEHAYQGKKHHDHSYNRQL